MRSARLAAVACVLLVLLTAMRTGEASDGDDDQVFKRCTLQCSAQCTSAEIAKSPEHDNWKTWDLWLLGWTCPENCMFDPVPSLRHGVRARPAWSCALIPLSHCVMRCIYPSPGRYWCMRQVTRYRELHGKPILKVTLWPPLALSQSPALPHLPLFSPLLTLHPLHLLVPRSAFFHSVLREVAVLARAGDPGAALHGLLGRQHHTPRAVPAGLGLGGTRCVLHEAPLEGLRGKERVGGRMCDRERGNGWEGRGEKSHACSHRLPHLSHASGVRDKHVGVVRGLPRAGHATHGAA